MKRKKPSVKALNQVSVLEEVGKGRTAGNDAIITMTVVTRMVAIGTKRSSGPDSG